MYKRLATYDANKIHHDVSKNRNCYFCFLQSRRDGGRRIARKFIFHNFRLIDERNFQLENKISRQKLTVTATDLRLDDTYILWYKNIASLLVLGE